MAGDDQLELKAKLETSEAWIGLEDVCRVPGGVSVDDDLFEEIALAFFESRYGR